MSPSQDTLFYIVRDQEQEGPISWADLQNHLVSGEVQPEHLCWSEGMDTWVPVGSLMPSARNASVPVPQIEVEERNPYAPPQADLSDKLPQFSRDSYYGGITRAPYWVITGGLSLIQAAISEKASFSVVLGVFAAFVIGTLWVCLMRIKNLGISRWWLLWMCIPLLNIVAGYRFMFCPEGWGDTRALDRKGKIALGLFIGLILLAFVAALSIQRVPNPAAP